LSSQKFWSEYIHKTYQTYSYVAKLVSIAKDNGFVYASYVIQECGFNLWKYDLLYEVSVKNSD